MLKKILYNCPTKKAWKKIGVRSHHGMNTPISSLRTAKSQGLGEFLDLIPMIDWMASIGFSVIQMLPIHDTGFSPSPYNALSSVALNPIYLRIDALNDASHTKGYQQTAQTLRFLDQKKVVYYHEVRKEKMRFFAQYFAQHGSCNEYKQKITAFAKKHSWVTRYALFLALKDKHQQRNWQYWPEYEKHPKNFFHLQEKYQEKVHFYTFLQMLCKEQMEIVKNYADKKGVFLKGDIPILLSPDSADVWADEGNFSLTDTVGCPPDLFNYDGQNWGFPVLRWQYLEKTKYAWWRNRLAYASLFFHLYRIDHLVGFFRIWAIPIGKPATHGRFLSENRKLWPFEGKERIQALIAASSMLPIGEDLGIMPTESRQILHELGISGTRLTRWVKYWEEDGSFIPSNDFDPISVTTLSTHDTETFAQWWEKYPLEAKSYAATRKISPQPTLTPMLRQACLEDAHASASIFHINLCMEYISMFDRFRLESPEQERINIPGIESNKNWSLRYKATIEQLAQDKPLEQLLTHLASL